MTWYRYSRVESQTVGGPNPEVKGDRRGSCLGRQETLFYPRGLTSGWKVSEGVLPQGWVSNRRGSYLGVKADPGHPVSVTLPTHDEISSGQVPHLPCLVITARHLPAQHDNQSMTVKACQSKHDSQSMSVNA